MLDDGTRQKDIGPALGISKSQVSKIRSKAIRDGLFDRQEQAHTGRISGSEKWKLNRKLLWKLVP